jgi:hypothetical protein
MFRCPQCNALMDASAEDGRLLSAIVCDACAGRKVVAREPWFKRRLTSEDSRSVNHDRRKPVRFSLRTLFSITTIACLFLAVYRLGGFVAFAYAADILVAMLGLANLLGAGSVWRLRILKMTFVEYLVLVAMCGILTSLAVPAVQTDCRGRRGAVAPVPVAAPAAANPAPGSNP